MFNREDRVIYTGDKHPGLNGKVGYICAPINNEPGVWVVDFADHSYVMAEDVLQKYRPSAKEDNIPEIQPRRRRKTEDDE